MQSAATGERPLLFGSRLLIATVVSLLAVLGFSGCQWSLRGKKQDRDRVEKPALVGLIDREAILAHVPDWTSYLIYAEPDQEQADRLLGLLGTSDVTIFLGTWCSDSRRELTRLWSALDLVGEEGGSISYVGVNRDKNQPAKLLDGKDVRYVPTVVVSRKGVELGRIVESSPGGIESDLAALLSQEVAGLITGRDDLEEGGADDPEP